jgi:hypothetical protein
VSAECNACGNDITYPENSWPVGRCALCDLRTENERLREALTVAQCALSVYPKGNRTHQGAGDKCGQDACHLCWAQAAVDLALLGKPSALAVQGSEGGTS